MGTAFAQRCAAGITFMVLLFSSIRIHAGDLVVTLSEQELPSATNGVVGFWLNALNVSDHETSWQPPGELPCQLATEGKTAETTARLAGPADGVMIAPGAFARREYRFTLPADWSGEVAIAVPDLSAQRLVLEVRTEPVTETPPPVRKGVVYFLKGRGHAESAAEYDPDTFFKQHIFGYEPLYFIAGTRSPNAKFQISFKYRLLNENGWLAGKAPYLTGLHLAYSQTSLWDWNAPSAPFYDSSYRPEILYSWDRVLGGHSSHWYRLDLQGGLQHESNGRAEPDSRSLNIAYFRPRLTLGTDMGPQVTLVPRAWVYVGDVDDNPDIADYRGYADLRAIFGWKRGLQVSALGRIGDDFSNGSVTVDVTYPLMQPPAGSFSLYLHAQYFNGYGESLIDYNERTEIFRAGISLYR